MAASNSLRFLRMLEKIQRGICHYRVDIQKKSIRTKIAILSHTAIFLSMLFIVAIFSFRETEKTELPIEKYFNVMNIVFATTTSMDLLTSIFFAFYTQDKYRALMKNFKYAFKRFPNHKFTTNYDSDMTWLMMSTVCDIVLCLSNFITPTPSILAFIWAVLSTVLDKSEITQARIIAQIIKEMIVCVDKHMKFWNESNDEGLMSEDFDLLVWNKKSYQQEKETVPKSVKTGDADHQDEISLYQNACNCCKILSAVFGVHVFFATVSLMVNIIASIFSFTATLKLSTSLTISVGLRLGLNIVREIHYGWYIINLIRCCEGVYQARESLRRTLATRAALGSLNCKDFLNFSKVVEARKLTLSAGPVEIRMSLVPAMIALITNNIIVLLQIAKIV